MQSRARRKCAHQSGTIRHPELRGRPGTRREIQKVAANPPTCSGSTPCRPAAQTHAHKGNLLARHTSSHPSSLGGKPACERSVRTRRERYSPICKAGNIVFLRSESESENGRIRTSTGQHSIVLALKPWCRFHPVSIPPVADQKSAPTRWLPGRAFQKRGPEWLVCGASPDRLRQSALERLGWRIYRIWSTDWFHNPDKELRKVARAIETARVAGPATAPLVAPRQCWHMGWQR